MFSLHSMSDHPIMLNSRPSPEHQTPRKIYTYVGHAIFIVVALWMIDWLYYQASVSHFESDQSAQSTPHLAHLNR